MVGVRRAGAAVVVLAVVSACASTVQPTGTTTVGAASVGTVTGDDGLSVPTTSSAVPSQPAGVTPTGVAQPTVATSRTPGVPSSSNTHPATHPAGHAPSATASATAIPATGRGWDAKHVYVGITTASDASNAIHALGISLDPGNEIADAKAVVADLNRRGGLFGRQVVLVDKDDSSARVLTDPTAAGQADCVYFTQDHPVISVVNTDATIDTDAFRSCFARAHMPLVSTTTAPFDDKTQATLAPYFYNTLAVSWTRLVPVLVSRLKAQRYFTGWNALTGKPGSGPVKVGVLYSSDPTGSRIGAALLNALHRAGVATDHFQYPSSSNAGPALSAVLRFKADRVTHVIGIDSWQFYFMTVASTQSYFPRYGVTTYNAPQSLLQSNGNPRELAGAVGLGWLPTLDVDAARAPGPGPGTKRCLSALARGGQHFARRFAAAVGLALCDGLQLGVLGAKAGGGLDPASIRRGIVSLGGGYPTGAAFDSGLSRTNFALPGGARDLAWNPSCRCFAYHGATYPVTR